MDGSDYFKPWGPGKTLDTTHFMEMFRKILKLHYFRRPTPSPLCLCFVEVPLVHLLWSVRVRVTIFSVGPDEVGEESSCERVGVGPTGVSGTKRRTGPGPRHPEPF